MNTSTGPDYGHKMMLNGILDSSPAPSLTEQDMQGGCNGGSGAALPPCPTADGRETVRVVGVSAVLAAVNNGEASPKAKLRSDSKQIWLVLPGLIVRDMSTLGVSRMGVMFMLMLKAQIGDPRDLTQLVSSAEQVGRWGVLLAQAIPYSSKAGDLAPLVTEIKAVLTRIKQLSLPRAKLYKSKSKADDIESGQPRRRIRWVGAVSLRLRLPVAFADELLEMPTDLRNRAIWLALDPGVAESFDIQKLIGSEERIRQAGRRLNQALRLAGKEHDLTELAPAVENVLVVLGTLRNLKLKGGEQ